MIRVSAHHYRLTDALDARKIDGAWFKTDRAGTVLDGPYGNVLEIRYAATVRKAARERRATLQDRTRTSRLAGGMLVEVLDQVGRVRTMTGTVRKAHPQFGPYVWQAGKHSGASPHFVAAVIAVAHIIDESEPVL